MKLSDFYKNAVLIGLVFALTQQMAEAKKMYRWVDDNGKVFFSDQVPPTDMKHKLELLNKDAQVVQVIEKSKTKEQVELDKRLTLLRQQQEKIIAEQKSHDKVLFSTFRSIDDIKASHENSLKAFDSQTKIKEKQLESLEKQLADQQKQAASHEVNNQKIPESLLTEIAKTQQQISNTKQDIAKTLEKREDLVKLFTADEQRFIFLAGQAQQNVGETVTDTIIEETARQLGLFKCDDAEQCLKAWDAARGFVKSHSTTAINVDTDKLIMSQPPATDTDLSLSASKMLIDAKHEQIFLDIQCRDTQAAQALCNGPKGTELRVQFSDYINTSLAGGTPTPTASAPAQ